MMPAYLVRCGLTNISVVETHTETAAIVAAIDHEVTHTCGTWWQRPLDGVSFYAPNVADPPRPQ